MLKTKKITSFILAAAILGLSSVFSGCGKDGKVSVTIGDWPADTDSTSAVYEEYKKQMNELYPDIEIIPDTSSGGATSYVTRAISGQLPNLYVLSYTEANNVIKNNFCADITEYCKKYDYEQSLNPLVLDKVKSGDKIYGIPQTAYALGLVCRRSYLLTLLYPEPED